MPGIWEVTAPIVNIKKKWDKVLLPTGGIKGASTWNSGTQITSKLGRLPNEKKDITAKIRALYMMKQTLEGRILRVGSV